MSDWPPPAPRPRSWPRPPKALPAGRLGEPSAGARVTVAGLVLVRHDSELLNAAAEMCYQIIVQDIFDGKMNDRNHARATFERHMAGVKATIPRERLLVYETGSGWKPLCDFLGVPEPDDPYPSTNSTREFKERIASRA